MGAWKITTAAVLEPISLSDAKDHLKITGTSEDGLIQAYLNTSISIAEEFCRQSFLTQTVEEIFTEFESMCLRFTPLQSVSSVEYYDSDNALQTLSSSVYSVDTWNKPSRIVLAVDQTWPAITNRFDAIKVTYLSGWTAASLVPAPIKDAIKLMVTDLYENRIDHSSIRMAFPKVRKTSHDLLRPYRILTL